MTVKISGNSSVSTPSFAGDDGDSGLHATADQVQLVTNGTVGMTVDSSQRVGVGTTSPANDLDVLKTASGATTTARIGSTAASGANNATLILNNGGTGDATLRFDYESSTDQASIGVSASDQKLTFSTAGSTAATIESDGDILLGTTDNHTFIRPYEASTGNLIIGADQGATGTNGSRIQFKTRGTEQMRVENSGVVKFQNGTAANPSISFLNDPDNGIYRSTTNTLGFVTAGSEQMKIHSTGYVGMGGFLGSTGYHRINGINTTEGGTVLNISGYQSSGGSSQDTAYFFACGDSATPSTSASAQKIFRISSTSRSISAAGTINASGADYAEYMFKAGDFTIAKGDVCGINAEGKLTNVFADAISFVVKSTDPSYVGGDTWHLNAGKAPGGYDDDRTEEEIAAAKIVYEQELEAARQMVDRIAFSGQVPVNVTGTTPGQYIVPAETADGGIEGVAKNEADLTFAEYMHAVGKVIAIEDDGRARIIVKVA